MDCPKVIAVKTACGSMRNYTYVAADLLHGVAVLVDPAWEMDKITRAVAQVEVEIRGILITHCHPDHIHLAEPLARLYDCPIWASREEIAASGFKSMRTVEISAEPWAVGRLWIEPLLTPGHTPGSVCYVIGRNVFTGDVLFAEGCGLCPDMAAAHNMFGSLSELRRRVTAQTRVFPGHSYGIPPGQHMSAVIDNNIYLHFRDKESFAAFRMRPGQNPAKLFNFV